MAVNVTTEPGSNIVNVRAEGKLSKADYEHFVPLLEKQIAETGKLRIVFEIHDFHGWEASALWEDIKFDVKHFRDIERLAIIGESKWEQGMAAFCKPFTTAKIKYFDKADAAQAQTWIKEA